MSELQEILPIRICNILMHEGIETMVELKARWEKDSLSNIKGIGRKSRNEIKFATGNSDISYRDAIQRMHYVQDGLKKMSEEAEYWKDRYQEKANQHRELLDISSMANESADIILRTSKVMMAYINYMKSKLDNDSISYVSLEEFSLIYSGGYGE